MPRSREEIEAEIERLNAELRDSADETNDTVEELQDVLDEAAEVTEDAVEDATEDAVEAIEEAIEEAAEEVVEEAPLIEDESTAEAAIAAQVISELEQRYDLTPRVPESVVVEEHHTVTEEPTIESPPRSEHWSRRRVF